MRNEKIFHNMSVDWNSPLSITVCTLYDAAVCTFSTSVNNTVNNAVYYTSAFHWLCTCTR